MKRRTLCSIRLMFLMTGIVLVGTIAQAADLQYEVFNRTQLAQAIIAANKVADTDTVTITIRSNIRLTSDLPVLQKGGTTIVGETTTGLPVTINGSGTSPWSAGRCGSGFFQYDRKSSESQFFELCGHGRRRRRWSCRWWWRCRARWSFDDQERRCCGRRRLLSQQ